MDLSNCSPRPESEGEVWGPQLAHVRELDMQVLVQGVKSTGRRCSGRRGAVLGTATPHAGGKKGGHLAQAQELDVGVLLRGQQSQGFTLAPHAGAAAHAVHEGVWILRQPSLPSGAWTCMHQCACTSARAGVWGVELRGCWPFWPCCDTLD